MSVHTIPVPRGWSPEQAWEHMVRGGFLEHPEGGPVWTNIEAEDVMLEPLPDGRRRVAGGRLVRWWR